MADLSKIKEVVETTHVGEVNTYIKAGWKLIDTAGGKWSDSQEAFIKYTLGWDQDTDPVKPRLW